MVSSAPFARLEEASSALQCFRWKTLRSGHFSLFTPTVQWRWLVCVHGEHGNGKGHRQGHGQTLLLGVPLSNSFGSYQLIHKCTNRQILYKYEWPWARSWSLAASGSGAKQRWKEKARGAFVRTQPCPVLDFTKNNRVCIVLLVKMGGSVRERYRIKCRSISALGDRCKSSAKIIFYQRSSLVIGFRFANRCLMI